MASSIKIVLRKKQNKDGTYPLAIRITKERKTSFIHLGVSLNEKDWDSASSRVKKSYQNSARLNAFIATKLAQANEKSLELETVKEVVSSNAVKQKIKPVGGFTFFSQAELYLAQLKEAGKYNQYTPDKARVENFRKFLKHDHAFSDVTVPMLEHFKTWLVASQKLSERTAVNHLVTVRSVFSFAIKAGVADERFYPFGRGKIAIKFPESIKLGLSMEELASLETVELNGKESHARNLWLFSYYFAGMRVSDVLRLRWSDFQNGRLYYAMGKNNKAGSLKIPDKAQAILDQYSAFRENASDLVFPELKGVSMDDKFVVQRTIGFKTSTIDKLLKDDVAQRAGIEKKLTMHIARHTFAQLAGDAIPVQMLQKLYRHSNVTTTIGYQSNFIHKDADDALDAVLNKNRPSPEP